MLQCFMVGKLSNRTTIAGGVDMAVNILWALYACTMHWLVLCIVHTDLKHTVLYVTLGLQLLLTHAN